MGILIDNNLAWHLPWWYRKALTQWPPFLNVIVLIRSKVYACWKWPRNKIGTWNNRVNFMAAEFFGRRRECRFYTAGCRNKMAVSVTGPRAVNELGGPVIPGTWHPQVKKVRKTIIFKISILSKIRKYLPTPIRILYYNYYIKPHLEYCWSVWGNCSKSDIDTLIKLQKQTNKLHASSLRLIAMLLQHLYFPSFSGRHSIKLLVSGKHLWFLKRQITKRHLT